MLLSVVELSVLQEAVGDCIPVLLLGNKVDNEKEREVPQGLGEQLAKVKSISISGKGRTLRALDTYPGDLVEAFSGSPLGGSKSRPLSCGTRPAPVPLGLAMESHGLQDGAD